MKTFLISFIALAAASFANAQSLLGDWNGSLKLGAQSLPLVLHISSDNGEKQCMMDSPNQGAKDIPAILDLLSEDSIALRVPSIGAAYCGKLKEGEIRGTFSQRGMKFVLNLKPGNFVRERPQTPQQPLLYPVEEVTFTNETDRAVLSGTLSYPMSCMLQQDVPVVLMVTGSGLQNRDEELMDHKPFAVLADYLAKMGIASLRYDDRGFGQSTGELTHTTSHTFMTDALAGIKYLESTGKFGKIGILGHSEGGTIAFMAAQACPAKIDFIVSLAGCALRGDKVLLQQNETLLRANPNTALMSADYCKVLNKVFHHLIEGKAMGNAQETVQQYCSEVGANLPVSAQQNLQTVLTTSNPWLNYFLTNDPAPAIAKTTCPVMAINGDKDTQVDAQTHLDAIRQYLPANEKHLIQTYSGLNHLFQHCQTGLVSEYATIDETISPEVLKDIAQWILSIK